MSISFVDVSWIIDQTKLWKIITPRLKLNFTQPGINPMKGKQACNYKFWNDVHCCHLCRQNLPTQTFFALKYKEILLSSMNGYFFFTPIPCTYTSSTLDGMAKNYFYYSTWIREIMQFIMSGSILFLPPYTRGEKKPFGLSWNRTQVLLLHKWPL